LRGDEESLRHALKTEMEDALPKSLEVTVQEIKDVNNYESPLLVSYEVKGKMGAATGKRLVLPVDLFEANSSATFPHEKRELPIYFQYQQAKQDAFRINFVKGFEVEAVPDAAKFELPSRELYNLTVVATATSFTTRRNYIVGEVLVNQTDYDGLRKFYTQFESKDKESVVLKIAAPTASPAN
jgi:hypothetical protein